MEFLKQKFYDNKGYLNTFLGPKNFLLKLEESKDEDSGVPEEIKKAFVKQFIERLVKQNILNQSIINSVTDLNPWSIDFPSWHGEFDEKKGKAFFIIGSEPHIRNKYLQNVYGFHGQKEIEAYLSDSHPLFRFISEILSYKYDISKEEVLKECYLTDLFPLSPFRGNGLKVGSATSLQKVVGENGSWTNIRYSYANKNLPFEINNVKPKLIITQGKQVFNEVIEILAIEEKRNKVGVQPAKGKKQYIRSVSWNNIGIISVPHIGSQRMKTFWNSNMDLIKEAIDKI